MKVHSTTLRLSIASVTAALFCVVASSQSSPRLSIRLNPTADKIRLQYPGDTSYRLEESSEVSGAPWIPVELPPTPVGTEMEVILPARSQAGFYRLRQSAPAPLTTIVESSPADGETGVAVTRETIVHFSAPLATSALLTTNNFYATFGGRRILSRAELSGERRRATLFYLEPLPGNARVNVLFNGEGLKDQVGRPIDAAGTGRPNGFRLIQFDTLSLTPLADTAVTGRVFASELVAGADTGTNATNRPLEGVTITVDGREQELRTTTDARGNFTLAPVPPGRFFVKIDGRTARGGAYPNGAYYPSVGKAWDAVPGRTNNLAGGTGEIYLPLIRPGTLQAVSATQDTLISFPADIVAANPALDGVTITVPANSLFSDNGTRGGKVGIAPVPPDRLPGPLPPGLEMPLVITVQTDGALNFDQPAPICFPNLRDPVLKTPLSPGSKQALISFNHDKGIWEAVGSMTVSADGKTICTDPGAGILQPGWHGVGPAPLESPPVPPDCSPQKNEPALMACRDYCKFALAAGTAETWIEFEAGLERCSSIVLQIMDPDSVSECMNGKLLLAQLFLEIADVHSRDCLARCEECLSPPGSDPAFGSESRNLHRSGSARLSADTGDQLFSIARQILALIKPFSDSNSPVPASVADEVRSLFAGAKAVSANLTTEARAADAQAAASALKVEPFLRDLDTGNPPPYPIFHVANITRPSGSFVLRGETGPQGRYSLFVPRDGTLRSVSFYDPRTRRLGLIRPKQNSNGTLVLPRFTLVPIPENAPDSDQDRLPDWVEEVYGTDPARIDSDNDGFPDGAEIAQGTNPLDGQPIRTGIIGTVTPPAAAVDLAAANDRLAIAHGAGGVSVFNLDNGVSPTLIAYFPAVGTAQRVAVAGDFVAVADGKAGVQIIGMDASSTPTLLRTLKKPGAQAIAADNGIAYVGFASGAIVALDLNTGRVMHELSVTNAVWDLALHGDHLYALSDNHLFSISRVSGKFAMAASISIPTVTSPNRRLFVGGGIAYSVHGSGYHSIDVADPARPVLLTSGSTSQAGWKHIAVNGSGTGVAAVGPNSVSPTDVSLYDFGDPRKNDQFLTQFLTPGNASAVVIHNGFAYVADGTAGLQVVNYLSFDTSKLPPTIALNTSATLGVAESSQPFRVTANAVDDVQVRHVEFYLDGQSVLNDGSFPFEYRFNLPALTGNRTNVLLRARAIDTGGNAVWSDEVTIQLGPDVTPPRVVETAPLGGARVITEVLAFFNEPMNPATLKPETFRLIGAGPDQRFNTLDDRPVEDGVVGYRSGNRTASLNLPSPLPDGLYRAVVTAEVADVPGNRLATDHVWHFRVADAVFWISDLSGSWTDGANWSTGTVPGPDDDVILENLPESVSVLHNSGVTVLKNLTAALPIQISGASSVQAIGMIDLQAPLTLDNGTLKGSKVLQNAEARLRFAPNAANFLDGMRIIGDLVLTNTSARAVIRNGLDLAGTVVLDNAGTILFAGNQAFNTGSIRFENFGAVNLEPGTTLTLGPEMVVHGKSGIIQANAFGTVKLINLGHIAADVPGGTLNFILSQFENQGRVVAGDGASVTILERDTLNSGTIDIQPGGTFTWNGAWTNHGTLRLNQGTLNLGGSFTLARLGNVVRTGGTLNLNGTLELEGGILALTASTGSWRVDRGTIHTGTVNQSPEATLLFAPNAANTLDALKVNGDLVITNTSTRVIVRNGLDLAGTVVLDNASAIVFAGNQTFNTGAIRFVNFGAVNLEPGTTLTLGPKMVVHGKSGFIQAGAFGTVTLINQGLISANIPGGTLNISPTQFENTGTLRADGAGTEIRILTTPFTNTGTIEELNGGKVIGR